MREVVFGGIGHVDDGCHDDEDFRQAFGVLCLRFLPLTVQVLSALRRICQAPSSAARPRGRPNTYVLRHQSSKCRPAAFPPAAWKFPSTFLAPRCLDSIAPTRWAGFFGPSPSSAESRSTAPDRLSFLANRADSYARLCGRRPIFHASLIGPSCWLRGRCRNRTQARQPSSSFCGDLHARAADRDLTTPRGLEKKFGSTRSTAAPLRRVLMMEWDSVRWYW